MDETQKKEKEKEKTKEKEKGMEKQEQKQKKKQKQRGRKKLFLNQESSTNSMQGAVNAGVQAPDWWNEVNTMRRKIINIRYTTNEKFPI